MRIFLLFVVSVFSCLYVQAQPQFAADYREAKYYEDLEDYKGVLTVYNKIYLKDTSNAVIKYKIGQVYAEKLNQPDKAMPYFIAATKSGDKNLEARIYYLVANYYKSKNQFQEALYTFQKYLRVSPIKDVTTVDAEKSVNNCRVGIQLLKRPISSTTTNMGDINSVQEDNHVVIAPDESFILFASNRAERGSTGGGNGTDIFLARRVTGVKYANPMRLAAPINTNGYDIPLCLMPDGKTLYLFNSLKNGGDIYVTTLDPISGKGTQPVALPATINSPEDYDGDASVSPDGSMMFFTSDREGGAGGYDIYMSKNVSGQWAQATQMKFGINTEGDETNPFYYAETKTLYFSSNKLPGIGETDIFKTTLKADGTWTPPQNVGIPINTVRDDQGFVISPKSKVAYTCSRGDVKEREGYQDLYQINIPKGLEGLATLSFTGVVKDKATQKPIEASIIIEDLQSKQVVTELMSDATDGSYTIILNPGKEYAISITAKGYLFTSDNVNLPADSKAQEVTRDQFLTPISKGGKVVLNNIFFDTGKATLKPSSTLELNRVVKVMQLNPKMKVQIDGHTDNQGDAQANLMLSQERAKSVADFLSKAGLDPTRIATRGFGQTQPVADNNTEDGRRLNRRTEFEILEN